MLAACGPDLSPTETLEQHIFDRDALLQSPEIKIATEPGFVYLIEADQHGADVSLLVASDSKSSNSIDMFGWLRGTEYAVIHDDSDDNYSITINPISVPRNGSLTLDISRFSLLTDDDDERLNAHRALFEAATETTSNDSAIWADHISRLEPACETFEELGLHQTYEQCQFKLGFITYYYTYDWSGSRELVQKLLRKTNREDSPELFAQYQTLLAMTMAEEIRGEKADKYQARLSEAAEILSQVSVDQKKLQADAEFSMTLNMLGYTAERNLQPELSDYYYQQAADLAYEQSADFQYTIAMNNLASRLKRSGKFHQSGDVWEQLIENTPNTPINATMLVDLHNEAATVYNSLGNWDKSIEHYTKALVNEKSISPDSRVRLMSGLTIAYLRTGNPDRARIYIEQILDDLDAINNVDAIQYAYQTASLLEQFEGHIEKAIALIDRALELEGNPSVLGQFLIRKAYLLGLNGQYETAIEIAEDSIQRLLDSDQMTNTDLLIQARLMKTELILDSGENDIANAKALIDEVKEDASQSDNIQTRFLLDFVTARYHEKSGNIDAAMILALQLSEKIWNQRSENVSKEYVTGIVSANEKYLTYHIELSLKQLAQFRDTDQQQSYTRLSKQILASVETIRYRLLLRGEQNNLSRPEHARLTSLEADARRLNYELTVAGQDEEQRKTILQSLEHLNRQIDLLQRTIINADVEVDLASAVDIEAIQASLNPDVDILNYWLGEAYGIVWFINNNQYRAAMINPREDIESLAHTIHRRTSIPSVGGKNQKLQQLSELILDPILLTDDTDPSSVAQQRKTLAIIPFGALSTLPFSALNMPSGRNLVGAYDIVFIPSLVTHTVLHEPPLHEERSIAIYADPKYDDSIRATAGMQAANVRSTTLQALPGTRVEAEQISGYFENNRTLLRIGHHAHRDNFLNDNLSAYQFIHIASHAVVDTTYPAASSIILSVYDESGQELPDNAAISPADISRLSLNADLVVLSACDTAMSNRFGLVTATGLHQSFLTAGAETVMGSSWRVDDEQASQLMTTFYRHVIEDRFAPHASLAKIQRDMINQNKKPYDWAGWLVYSSPRMIYNN